VYVFLVYALFVGDIVIIIAVEKILNIAKNIGINTRVIHIFIKIDK